MHVSGSLDFEAADKPMWRSEPVVAIAGLWSAWRKPVVLKPAQQEAWLAPQCSPEDVAQLVAGAREDLAGHAVGVAVNNTRNDSPELLQPQA